MKKLSILLLILFVVLASVAGAVEGKKLLPRSQSGAKSSVQVATRGVATAVKFRGDRRAINVTFRNLGIASRVEYTLTYTANNVSQGISGTITPTKSEESRELLFGTCSGNVCTYHQNIKNARFTVTTTLKNGRKVVKPFKLRV